MSPLPLDDPFAVLGVERQMNLPEEVLETRYLQLSRACHPDFHGDAPDSERAAILARSAQLNDAYSKLMDPWARARCLVEIAAPGVMQRNQALCPAFLMAAMELAEDIEAADPSSQLELVANLRANAQRYLNEIADRIERSRWDAAAVKLHEVRYLQKAIDTLGA